MDTLRTGTFPDPSSYEARESTTTLDLELIRQPATYFFAGYVYPPHGRSIFVIPPELDVQLSGIGSPFDSGGLVHHHCLASTQSDKRQYLREHECGLPDFREYLGLHLTKNFKSVEAYLRGAPKAGIDDCPTADEVKPLACAFEVRHESSLALSASVRLYVDEECYYEHIEAMNASPDVTRTPDVIPVVHPDRAVAEYIKGIVSRELS